MTFEEAVKEAKEGRPVYRLDFAGRPWVLIWADNEICVLPYEPIVYSPDPTEALDDWQTPEQMTNNVIN